MRLRLARLVLAAIFCLAALAFAADPAAGRVGEPATPSSGNELARLSHRDPGNLEVAAAGNGTGGNATLANEAAIENDRNVLVALYRATGGERWTNSDSWLSDEPLHSWHGVFTGRDGRVELLVLPENGLSGNIPAEIAALDRLRVLDLAGNQLSGQIPPAIGGIGGLQTLKLEDNRLSGRIPPEIGNLSNLEHLELSANRFGGSIPAALAGLASLHTLRIADSGLDGTIPPELAGMASLKILDLEQNSLRGDLAAEFGQMPLLVELSLSGNHLSGAIPPELGRMPRLGFLDLSWNRFSGQIPAQLADPPGLKSLILGGNTLTGPIPPEFGRAVNLVDLLLNDNELDGPIPAELGRLTRLRGLFLNDNRLTGPIPSELGRAGELRRLDVGANQLSGEVPPGLHRLANLITLRLGSGNSFSGCLPGHWLGVIETDAGSLQLPECEFGLPGLDVIPGRLEPGFAPAIGDYQLWVGGDVEFITLDPILADATVTYQDRAGNVLADADPDRAGHQTLLADASDQIRIQVTAGDGQALVTYRVTARRLFPYRLRVLDSEQIAAPGNKDLIHNVPDLETSIDGRRHVAGFLDHFHRTEGLERWGFPTSEVMALEPNSLTQFYQRGVVDFHNVGAGWVTERRLAWDYIGGGLGGSPDLGVEPDVINPYPGQPSGPWGHVVSNQAIDGTWTGFSDFYHRLGGVSAFGFAKTDARRGTNADGTLHVDGQLPGFVRQYFQAAVFERHPGDRHSPVKLSLLGDTLRNRLVPGFADELVFAPAGPLAKGAAYLPPGASTPRGLDFSALREGGGDRRQEFPLLDTDRVSIQVFEGGREGEPQFERPRLGSFNNLTTRFLWWALEIELRPSRIGTLRTPLEIRYFRPSGSVMHFDRLEISAELRRESHRVYYSGRNDRQILGSAAPGTYRVEVSRGGRVVAATRFEILATQLPRDGLLPEPLQPISWAQAPDTRAKQEAVLRLVDLHAAEPEIAGTLAGWEWVRSELNPRKIEVIQLLGSLARRNPALARQLVTQPWLADGVSLAEWRNLLAAHEFEERQGDPGAGSAPEDSNSFAWRAKAVRYLSRIESELPHVHEQLRSKPWFADGIGESESALLSVLIEVSESEEITSQLLAGPPPRAKRISTSYSDEIDLTVVSRHSVRLPTNLMDGLEIGMRTIEDHLGIPWPSTDIVVYLDPELNSVLDGEVGGFYTHDFIGIARSPHYLPILYHELGHFYLFSGDEVLWLQESGPEYLAHHASWKRGALSIQDWERQLGERMERYCHQNGAQTVRDYQDAVAALEERDFRSSPLWICHYQIGHNLLFKMHQVLGEQATGAALGEVILKRQITGRAATDEEALNAFRARAVGEQAIELDRVIAAAYGPG